MAMPAASSLSVIASDIALLREKNKASPDPSKLLSKGKMQRGEQSA